ncbi:MAG: pentapeptide repeat-containing protein [bacterium]
MSNKCSYEGCEHKPPDRMRTCIFHAKKETVETVKEFRIALGRLLRQYRREKPKIWDFRGFVFPDSEKVVGRPIRFGRWRYTQGVSFEKATFQSFAVFGGATFQSDAHFDAASFQDNTWFAEARFKGAVWFEGATFHGAAWFQRAIFSSVAWFVGATFQRHATFSGAIFHAAAWFDGCVFSVNVPFFDAVFAGNVRFIWPGSSRRPPNEPFAPPLSPGTIHFKDIKYERGGTIDFSNNDLREGCRVIFEKCNLSRTRFLLTDCTKIEFIDCKWAVVRGRNIVGDEYLARFDTELTEEQKAEKDKNPDWRLIAITYNQLARNYRERLDYPHVHAFDQGNMVVRRMAFVPTKGWRKKWWDSGKLLGWRRIIACFRYYFTFLSFYCYFSNYGTSYWRAVAWLFGSIVGFGLLYYKSIDTLCFGQAMRLSLAVATLNRAGMAEAFKHSIWLDAIASFQIVLTATLVALFLFAIRRRFKR